MYSALGRSWSSLEKKAGLSLLKGGFRGFPTWK